MAKEDDDPQLEQHETPDGKIDNTKLNEFQRFLIKQNLDTANNSRIEHRNTQIFRNRTHNSLLQFESTVDFKNLNFKDIAKVVEKPAATREERQHTSKDWKIKEKFTKVQQEEIEVEEEPKARKRKKREDKQVIRPRHVNRGFVPKGYNLGV